MASIAINAIAAMPYWKYWDSNPLYAAMLSNEISRGYFLNVLVVDLALEIIIAGDCQAVDEDMDMRTAARQPARPFLRRLSTLPG